MHEVDLEVELLFEPHERDHVAQARLDPLGELAGQPRQPGRRQLFDPDLNEEFSIHISNNVSLTKTTTVRRPRTTGYFFVFFVAS